MDFTREPVVETVITPREGCKLVVRSSKGAGYEEYFVDSVEVVCFGNAFFFRSLEKPKNFLLPVIDYEVLEVREARMVLKHVGAEKTIKIGGGKQPSQKKSSEKTEPESKREEKEEPPKTEPRKRERRKNYRRRRGKEERTDAEGLEESEKVELPKPAEAALSAAKAPSPEVVRTLLTPPPLISETISRYREDFSQAFYPRPEDCQEEEDLEEEEVSVSSFSVSDEENDDYEVSERELPEPSEDLWNFTEEVSSKEESQH